MRAAQCIYRILNMFTDDTLARQCKQRSSEKNEKNHPGMNLHRSGGNSTESKANLLYEACYALVAAIIVSMNCGRNVLKT